MTTPRYGPGIEIAGLITDEYAEILTGEALAFAARLAKAAGLQRLALAEGHTGQQVAEIRLFHLEHRAAHALPNRISIADELFDKRLVHHREVRRAQRLCFVEHPPRQQGYA